MSSLITDPGVAADLPPSVGDNQRCLMISSMTYRFPQRHRPSSRRRRGSPSTSSSSTPTASRRPRPSLSDDRISDDSAPTSSRCPYKEPCKPGMPDEWHELGVGAVLAGVTAASRSRNRGSVAQPRGVLLTGPAGPCKPKAAVRERATPEKWTRACLSTVAAKARRGASW